MNEQRERFGALLLLLLVAATVRVVFYTGPMGSDDAVYTRMAVAILHGDWSVPEYIGALRYGVNLPVAGLMFVFGTSEFAANLWSLLTSLGEVITVYFLANRMWGRAAAVLSAGVLALLPLHVHMSGRLMADAPLTFFVTLAFALFYFAEQRRSRALYLAAGLALGAVYWTKEGVAVLILPVFVVYALSCHVWRKDWLWLAAGGLFMFLLNAGFMWWLSGDPMHLVHSVRTSIVRVGRMSDVATSPAFYFRYLFFDIRHTWLMPFLAVGGLWHWYGANRYDARLRYVVIWSLTLLATLSFGIVGVMPIQWIQKQTNYMQIFVAPLCLLAGFWLASHLQRPWMPLLLVILIGGSVALCGMEQQAVRVFVANSRAALAYQAAHPLERVYGSGQAYSLSSVSSALEGNWPSRPGILPIDALANDSIRSEAFTARHRAPLVAIVDPETAAWGSSGANSGAVPACWIEKEDLIPSGFGVGRDVLAATRAVAKIVLSERWGDAFLRVTDPYYEPRRARVYQVPSECLVPDQIQRPF